jgi:hypothetical protein
MAVGGGALCALFLEFVCTAHRSLDLSDSQRRASAIAQQGRLDRPPTKGTDSGCAKSGRACQHLSEGCKLGSHKFVNKGPLGRLERASAGNYLDKCSMVYPRGALQGACHAVPDHAQVFRWQLYGDGTTQPTPIAGQNSAAIDNTLEAKHLQMHSKPLLSTVSADTRSDLVHAVIARLALACVSTQTAGLQYLAKKLHLKACLVEDTEAFEVRPVTCSPLRSLLAAILCVAFPFEENTQGGRSCTRRARNCQSPIKRGWPSRSSFVRSPNGRNIDTSKLHLLAPLY